MSHPLRIGSALAALLVVLASSEVARADLIAQWNSAAIAEIKLQGGTIAGPNPASRALAITHIVLYDVVANFDGSHEPYLVELKPPKGASVEAAVAGAAHFALAVLLPARRTALNTRLNEALDAIDADDDAKDLGYDFGVEVADQILTSRGGDGATLSATDPGSTDLGKWRPLSAGAADQALEPAWRNVTPFALDEPDQLRPPAPPALASTEYVAAVEEVRSLGASAATAVTTALTRTAVQTEIADFWRQPTHIPFNAIARQVVNARDLTLEESARFFAQLAIAIADSRIAAWDAKYEYDHWRPITAIRTDDGSAVTPQTLLGTTLDADWSPYLATPAHPDYPSGHSTTGAAASAVLTAWFGDDVGFTVASDTLAGVTRAFASFSQAAEENGRSRIYGGIHFQFANAAGQALGKAIGNYVVAELFAAVPQPEPVVDAGADEDDAGVPEDAGHDAGPAAPDAAVADAGARSVDAGKPVLGEPDSGAAVPPPATGEDAGPPFVADAGGGKPRRGGDDSSCAVSRVRTGGAAGQGLGAGLALLIAAARLGRRRRKAGAYRVMPDPLR